MFRRLLGRRRHHPLSSNRAATVTSISSRTTPSIAVFWTNLRFVDKLSDKRRCDVHVDEYFTKEGAIEHVDLIVTGVPRAGRDPELTSAPASTPLTRIAERQP
jgi:hypothetical protein